jgi:hypothetical protein
MVDTSPRSTWQTRLLGHAHPLGNLGLSQAQRLAAFVQPVPTSW